ncbi:unnamed protein product [Paramecium pentaurelia]|uniref:Uncharacterized protein n=1 Tax=Paramecium pentaurelia TaxID=43138 RepID=A0A8S1VJL1_9CILI|nr:unnamed protein product [Paramecium pentaurelia]
MLGKKQSSFIGFNPFNKIVKENPSISTKIINKLKSLFYINLNPSSCIKRELISQQTIYVPVDLEIVGAQTIEHDSIQICNSQNSIKQRRNKFMSFDDHINNQQNEKVQQNELSQKVQQKENKHMKKFNQLQYSFDPVFPEDIDIAQTKQNNIIHPKRKLSSQQYKKRKLDQKKQQVGIKFVFKDNIQDQIQDSINESRIKEVPEQMTDDSLKDNSLLVSDLKKEPKNKEMIIIQLDDEKQKQIEPPMFTINEIIVNQSKGLKKSQSMINLNEQESKSITYSPKIHENSQSRKHSDIINKINETKQIDPFNDQVKKDIIKNEKLTEFSVQPQQNVINFLVQGSEKQDIIKIKNSNTQLLKEVSEEKKISEQKERNINNFSDTPLFGFGKYREGQQEQVIQNKINVHSSIFSSYDSKDLNLQNSSNQSQNLQQNQFTFLQNKSNISVIQDQPSNSNGNNQKNILNRQEENKQNNGIYNNTSNNQNEQFRPMKQLFQNLIFQPQSILGEQKKEENKYDQSEDNQPNSIGLNFQLKSNNESLKQQTKNEQNKCNFSSSDQLIKQVTTPVKQIGNPFLQQSPKIDQEQIISYFSNHSQQQNRNNQDDPAKIQTSQFSDDLFKLQNNGTSMFNPQSAQSSLFSFQQLSNQQNQSNQFLTNFNVFQTSVNNNMNINNNSMNNNNNMEITNTSLPNQQFQFKQQLLQTQNPLGSFNQPQSESNNFYPQIQQQISSGFNVIQFNSTNPKQQNEHQNQLLQLPQTNCIFTQDSSKLTNQSQSLNSSFQSRNAKRKQRIDP